MSKMREQEKLLKDIVLTKKEMQLMHFLFVDNPTQEDIDRLTEGIDVDEESSNYMLMLAYLGHQKGWNFFPKEMAPRFKGLYRYYHVRNSLGVPGLAKHIGILSDAGIPVMLIKGMAMRTYYAPNVPRIMSDMDILVPEEKFELARFTLCAMGGKIVEESPHSMGIVNGHASVDLHRWMYKTHNEKGFDLWQRARKIDFNGVEAYVPSPEDMFVHLLDNQSRNIVVREGLHRRMKWLYDCRRVTLHPDGIDWNIVAEKIKDFGTEHRMRLMLQMFDQCFPHVVPEYVLDMAITDEKDYEKWLKRAYRAQKARIYHGKKLEAGKLLPRVFAREILRRAEYLYLEDELKRKDPNITYLKHVEDYYGVNSIGALLKNRINRTIEIMKGKK